MNIKGKNFGKWTVLYYDDTKKYYWYCRCECGTERSVKQYNLIHGYSNSCGCINVEKRKYQQMENKIIIENNIAKIILGGSEGKIAIIDVCDLDKIKNRYWSVYNGYAGSKNNINKDFVYMHRLICNVDAQSIDHKDADPMNNRYNNLRPTNQKMNSGNRKRLNKNNTSGYRGVYKSSDVWRKRKWVAKIKMNYKNKHLGYYFTAEEAAKTYNDVAEKYFGEFAVLNKIKSV